MTAQSDMVIPGIDDVDLLARDDIAGDIPECKWGATLAELIDVLFADWRRQGRDEDEAMEHAQRTTLLIARHFGARPFYLPRADRLMTAMKHRLIFNMHKGNNVDALADRFGLSTRQIERIYVEQRQLQIRKRQGRLFPDA